jgi:hypothetical protein
MLSVCVSAAYMLLPTRGARDLLVHLQQAALVVLHMVPMPRPAAHVPMPPRACASVLVESPGFAAHLELAPAQSHATCSQRGHTCAKTLAVTHTHTQMMHTQTL